MNTRMKTNTLLHHDRRKSWKSEASCYRGMLLMVLLLAVSCTRESIMEQPSGDSEDVALNFEAYMATGDQPQSRAIDGDKFPSDNKPYPIGMWICEHEDTPKDFAPIRNGYDNLLATLAVVVESAGNYKDLWKYTVNGVTHDKLSVRRRRPVDIYAYYPHVENAADPTNIPFTTGDTDWMWADQCHLTEGDLTGASVPVELQFQHAMTALRVQIKCKYSGSVILTSMTLTDSEERLYTSGSMNLIDKTLNLVNRTEKLTINYNTGLNQEYKDFYIIMPPIENYANQQFTLSFVFNGIPAKTNFPIPNEINNSSGQSVPIMAFEAGKRYTYRLTLDNMLDFEPIEVDDMWTKVPDVELEL